MQRRLITAGAALLVATTLTACGGGGGDDQSSGSQTRKVLVDYRHDEAETAMFGYYPTKVTVRPGDVVEFDQAWTGEPHSVTFGRIVDPVLTPLIDLFDRVTTSGVFPEGEPEEFANFNLPYAFGEEDAGMAQNAAQPCFVAEADSWPGDERTPCPQRAKPAFTGNDAVYSSGLIPFEGVGGNSFRMPIAADATPGTYSYYCNVHGPLQYGQVEIVPEGTAIPSARDVAKEARRQAEAATAVLVANVKAAKAGRPVMAGEVGDEKIETKGKRLIGVPIPFFYKKQLIHGVVNEFVPKQVTAKVGEKVTWTFVSGHTISFNVPKYFPVFTIADDGTVTYNDKADKAAGWPAPPEEEHREEGPPPDPVKIDAGAWDGEGFRSSGLDYPDGSEFSVTFTKAGTYPYACLIHPTMVGTIVVK